MLVATHMPLDTVHKLRQSVLFKPNAFFVIRLMLLSWIFGLRVLL